MKSVLYLVAAILLSFPACGEAQTTPNMAIQKPTPLSTPGPTWAQMLNSAFDKVDAHDHSSGKGVKVGPSGLNINADLEFNGNAATELKSLNLEDQTSVTGSRKVYAKGNDLYYRNGAGSEVQITSGTSVVSSITGAFATTVPGAYPYSVTGADAQRVLLVNTSSTRTIALPAATTAVLFIIHDVTGAAETNNITVQRSGSDTIDGAASNKTLNVNSGWWLFISDGVAGWRSTQLSQSQDLRTVASPTFAGLTLSSPLPVNQGGTGSTTASTARTALGVGAGDSPSFAGLTTTGASQLGGNVTFSTNNTYQLGNTSTPNLASLVATAAVKSASTDLILGTATSHDVKVSPNNVNRWTFASGGDLVSIAPSGLSIRANTADGSDTGNMCIAAGGSCAAGRGSTISLNGNESSAGNIEIASGNAFGSTATIKSNGDGGGIIMHTNGSPRWVFSYDGKLSVDPTNGSHIVLSGTLGVAFGTATSQTLAGSDQAGARAIIATVTEFTGGSGTQGARLFHPSIAGLTNVTTIFNNAGNGGKLYPASGDQINNLGTNNPYVVPATFSIVECLSVGPSQWYCKTN